MPKKLTYDFVKEAVEKSGYKLLSKEYKNNNTKLLIECSQGHRYKVVWSVFQQGSRCPLCSEGGGFKSKKPGYLYYLKLTLPEGIFYKIGITNNQPEQRAADISNDAEVIWCHQYLFGEQAREEEQRLLSEFSEFLANDRTLNINSGHTEVLIKDVLRT